MKFSDLIKRKVTRIPTDLVEKAFKPLNKTWPMYMDENYYIKERGEFVPCYQTTVNLN